MTTPRELPELPVPRFSLAPGAGMIPYTLGKFVAYEDYAALATRLAESEARAEGLRALVNEADTALGALLIECDNERWPKTASQGTCLAYARKARAAIAQEAEREAGSA